MMSGTNVSRERLMHEAPHVVQPLAHNAPAKVQDERRQKQKRKSHLAVACCENTCTCEDPIPAKLDDIVANDLVRESDQLCYLDTGHARTAHDFFSGVRPSWHLALASSRSKASI